jgi:hypothetical protein
VISEPLSVERFLPIYHALQKEGTLFVVIGGQACSLWAKQYHHIDAKLSEYLPYTTLDLDLCAEKVQAVLDVAKALEVEPAFPKKGTASPEMGILKYELAEGAVYVQILRGGFNVNAKEIIERRQTYLWTEHSITLELMHPVLCLQEKTAALCRRHQRGKQDLKHLRMALRFVPAFIEERLQEGVPARPLIEMCQRILEVAESRDGMACYLKRGLRVEVAIPTESLANSGDSKLLRFVDRELRMRLERLRNTRKKAKTRLRVARTTKTQSLSSN